VGYPPHIIGNPTQAVFTQRKKAPKRDCAVLTRGGLGTPLANHRNELRQVGFELGWVNHLCFFRAPGGLELPVERGEQSIQAAPLGGDDRNDR